MEQVSLQVKLAELGEDYDSYNTPNGERGQRTVANTGRRIDSSGSCMRLAFLLTIRRCGGNGLRGRWRCRGGCRAGCTGRGRIR